MKWSIGKKIWLGLVVPVGILFIVGGIAHWTMNALVETTGWVDHSHQVLRRVADVISTMKDAETGQRGYLLTGEEHYLEPYTVALSRIHEATKALRSLTTDSPNQQRRIEAFEDAAEARLGEIKETIQIRRTKGIEAALAVVRTNRGKKSMDEVRRLATEMEKEEADLLQRRTDDARSATRTAKSSLWIGILLGTSLALLVGVFVVRDISGTSRQLVLGAHEIGRGQLAHRVNLKRGDELGTLGEAFDHMAEQLLRANNAIRDAMTQLASGCAEILAATTEQAAGTAEEATAVQETSATVGEVRQTAQVAMEKSRAVAETAQRTSQVSLDGRKSVEETVDGMQETKRRMEALAERILGLSGQAQAIAEIIATVNDLAERSNLLAVNAAIEAAKAGEAGRGFGVVAGEVKALAEQSKQATAQVRTILTEIQRATQAAVMAAEQGVKTSEAGAVVAGRAGEAIRVLSDSVEESAQSAQQILASTQQQAAGMDQIALAMQNIQQASTQNVAATRQVEQAAQNLNEVARRLATLVAASTNSVTHG